MQNPYIYKQFFLELVCVSHTPKPIKSQEDLKITHALAYKQNNH